MSENPQPVLHMVWRDVSTVLVDQPVAFAIGNDLLRVTLAEIAFNSAPNAETPILRPTITLAGSFDGMEAIARDILERVAQARAVA